MTIVALRRRYLILTALRWFPTGFGVSTLVLLMSERGLGVAAIGGLAAAFSATTVLFELPTGGLADVIGRRPVLVASALLTVVASCVMAFGVGAWWLGAAYVLMGICRALDSGPLQAWFVDGALALDPGADLRAALSRAGAVESVALAAGALGGGALVAVAPLPTSDAALIALSAPFLAAGIFALVQAAFVAAWVRDPPRTAPLTVASLTADLPGTIRRGAHLASHRASLKRILVATAAVGAALAGLELLGPLRAASLLGGESVAAAPYAVLITCGFLGSAAGSSLAPSAVRALRSTPRTAFVGMVGAAIALAGVAAPTFGVFATAYVAFYVLLGIMSPLADELLHREVDSAERATMLSVSSMALQVTGIVVAAGAGPLAAATSLSAAILAVAVVLALGSLAWLRWPHASAADAEVSPASAAD